MRTMVFEKYEKIWFSFKITEELEKVKQEMEEKGSSMTDGGKSDLEILPQALFPTSELLSNI